MYWEYRIIKHDAEDNEHFAVHEVHFDKTGKVVFWTEKPVGIQGDSQKEVQKALSRMTQDCKNSVLGEKELLRLHEKS